MRIGSLAALFCALALTACAGANDKSAAAPAPSTPGTSAPASPAPVEGAPATGDAVANPTPEGQPAPAATDTTTAAPAEASARTRAAIVFGSIAVTSAVPDATRVLTATQPRLRMCFHKVIESDANARGGAVTFMVRTGADGSVTDAQVVQNGAKLPKDAMKCMTTVLAAQRFGATGQSSVITIPARLSVRDTPQ